MFLLIIENCIWVKVIGINCIDNVCIIIDEIFLKSLDFFVLY